jgi:serine-type D-Ala-D-Ala carboxypeptidase/endopeptidase (penicillin-binding protein 4)
MVSNLLSSRLLLISLMLLGSVSSAPAIGSPARPHPPNGPAPVPPTAPLDRLAQAPGGICPAQLSSLLMPITQRVGGAQWGVVVQTQEAKPQTLFTRNPTTLLMPASNNKLFTTAAALSKLTANYRIRTPILGNGTGPQLDSLRIIGQGDPTLTTAGLDRAIQQLKARGIRNINQVVGDDTTFQGPLFSPLWDKEDVGQAYAPPISSLVLNQNIIGITLFPQQVGQALRIQWDDPTDAKDWRLSNDTITVGPRSSESIEVSRDGDLIIVEGQLKAGGEKDEEGIAVTNAGNYLVAKLRDRLTSAGISVGSATLVRRSVAPAGLVELAAIESQSLGEIVLTTNTDSNNLFAESLLRILGRQRNPTATDTAQAGALAIQEILAGMGVEPKQLAQVDGSGLSRSNRASALALVQTLQGMARGADAALYRRSLPVAGVSGTLKTRFRGTPAQGIVFAKTGTITGVVSLAGYVTPPNYLPLTFGVIVNSGASASAVRSAVDELVVNLAKLKRC